MPQVLMNFQHRNGWSVHFIEADCKSTIGTHTRYFDFKTLRRPTSLRQSLPPTRLEPRGVRERCPPLGPRQYLRQFDRRAVRKVTRAVL